MRFSLFSLILFCNRHVQSKSRGCMRRDGPKIDNGSVVMGDETNQCKVRRGAQWKESSSIPNKVCNNNVETPKKEESLETEHVEIPPTDEALM